MFCEQYTGLKVIQWTGKNGDRVIPDTFTDDMSGWLNKDTYLSNVRIMSFTSKPPITQTAFPKSQWKAVLPLTLMFV